MLVLKESEIRKNQREMVDVCIKDIFARLEAGKALFSTFFPKAVISVINDDKEAVRYPADEVMKSKITEIKSWINGVLDDTLVVYEEIESENKTPKSIHLPDVIAKRLIRTILEILSCGRDLRDNDYYFISDVGMALNLESTYIVKTVEQIQYEIRRVFFESLLTYLNEEQCFLCAVLLYRAIQADNQIHPAEFKYIENINQLLKNDQSKLEEVQKAAGDKMRFDLSGINEEIAVYLFKYLVEIVLCDQDFDPKESEYVNGIAQALGFDHVKRDEILQPIAATLMVKDSLFPKIVD